MLLPSMAGGASTRPSASAGPLGAALAACGSAGPRSYGCGRTGLSGKGSAPQPPSSRNIERKPALAQAG